MEKKSNPNRSSGVLLHITSLPGPYGIGEIGTEAKKFIDNLVIMGQDYWQMLPTNYPEKCNSPYDTNSAFGQNPFLISLDGLIKDNLIEESDLLPIPSFNKKNVQFEQMKSWKLPILKKAASNFSLSSEDQITKYKYFCEQQKFWINDYAFFMVIKELQNKKDWSKWDVRFKEPSSAALKEIGNNFKDEIENVKILQYLFYKQWKRLREYANQKGVRLIGDIPIYVSFNSADVWSNKDLFKLDENCTMLFQSGVPPDHFMESGQLWGHPIYNWKGHQDSNFTWWIHRIKHIMEYVDLIRIDHFNGLAKYWEVPITDMDAKHGQWVEAKGPELLENIFTSIEGVNLIAEDLGEASTNAAVLRHKYNIPGMNILQFSFNDIGGVEKMDKNTVLYTGTHDNDTSIGWFESLNDKLSTNELNNVKKVLNLDFEEVHWSMIDYALKSRAETVIIPAQDILGLGSDARMNTPGIVNEENWTWRLNDSQLNNPIMEKMKNISDKANRT